MVTTRNACHTRSSLHVASHAFTLDSASPADTKDESASTRKRNVYTAHATSSLTKPLCQRASTTNVYLATTIAHLEHASPPSSTATLLASWTHRRRHASRHQLTLTTYLPQIQKLKQIPLPNCHHTAGTHTMKPTCSWIHKTPDYHQTIRPRTRITALTPLAGAPLMHLAGAQLTTLAGAPHLTNVSAMRCASSTFRTTLLTLAGAPTLVSLGLCCWRGETNKPTSTCH